MTTPEEQPKICYITNVLICLLCFCPAGRGSAGHKGQRRHFTTPEEINARKEKQEKERLWRERRNEGDEDDEDKESGDSSSEEEE